MLLKRACERAGGNEEWVNTMQGNEERESDVMWEGSVGKEKRQALFSIFRIFEYKVHNHGNSIHIMEYRAGVVD